MGWTFDGRELDRLSVRREVGKSVCWGGWAGDIGMHGEVKRRTKVSGYWKDDISDFLKGQKVHLEVEGRISLVI